MRKRRLAKKDSMTRRLSFMQVLRRGIEQTGWPGKRKVKTATLDAGRPGLTYKCFELLEAMGFAPRAMTRLSQRPNPLPLYMSIP